MSNPYNDQPGQNDPTGQQPHEGQTPSYDQTPSFDQQPYDQQPYDQQPQDQQLGGYDTGGYAQQGGVNPYAAQPAYGGGVPQEHPQGTMILILGIVGFFVTICGPIAWVMGHKAQKEIAASGVSYSNEQNINIGKILGMVVSILAIIGIVIAVVAIVIGGVVAANS